MSRRGQIINLNNSKMRKLIKKLLAPLVREVVQEEIKKLNQQVQTVLLSAVSNAERNVKLEKSALDNLD